MEAKIKKKRAEIVQDYDPSEPTIDNYHANTNHSVNDAREPFKIEEPENLDILEESEMLGDGMAIKEEERQQTMKPESEEIEEIQEGQAADMSMDVEVKKGDQMDSYDDLESAAIRKQGIPSSEVFFLYFIFRYLYFLYLLVVFIVLF
jgi:hypothetical protein